MKVVLADKTYSKAKVDVQRSIDMSIERLNKRISKYKDQNIDIRKVFNDDSTIHNIINDNFYVYKTKANQMQIRLLYTIKNNKLVIVSHWYKNRTNNDYIKYFKEITSTRKEKYYE